MLKVKQFVREQTESNKQLIIDRLRDKRDYVLVLDCPILSDNFFSAGYIGLSNSVANYRVKVVTRLSNQTLTIQYTRV